jgi:hypothetical protein
LLKKLIVAVLACLTIFLSKRTMTEGQGRSLEHNLGGERVAHDGITAPVHPVRTAVLF